MRKGLVLVAAFVSVMAPVSDVRAEARPRPLPSVEAIVDRALAARGGLDRIRAVRAVRLTGHIAFLPGSPGPLTVEIARGGRMRESFVIDGHRILQVTDGVHGWMVRDDGAPRELSAAELANMAGGADLDGPLVDSAAKGDTVTLVGLVRVHDRDAWVLRIAEPDGRVRRDAIDRRTHLEARWEGDIGPDGVAGMESWFDDYRSVAGLRFAFAIDSDAPGRPGGQRIRFDRIEIGVALDAARFAKPAVPADSLARTP